jgi:hypothetical protein
MGLAEAAIRALVVMARLLMLHM